MYSYSYDYDYRRGPTLTPEQKRSIENIKKLTLLNSEDCYKLLKKHDFDYSRTLRLEWEIIPKKQETLSIESVFHKYANSNEDLIDIEGSVQFIQDLELDLADPAVLALAYELDAPSEGVFTKLGFIQGWMKLGAYDLTKMKQVISEIAKTAKTDSSYFKNVYRFTFSYIKAEGTRSLPTESAVAYWDLLLADKFPKLPQWNEFITTIYKKSVSKDTWNMILEFANYFSTDPTLQNYDLEASWPSVIDEFVDYLRENSLI